MGTWVPESERDTAWYIFHQKFLCRVSNIQSMSVEYLQHFGMPAVGDPRFDAQTANELINRMLTINEMVEFHKRGVTVGVCKITDTKRIYDYISAHLLAWRNKLENEYNTRGAPIEDLILLDQFANVVYRHAAPLFNREIVDSILARKMANTLRVSRTQLFPNLPKATTINAIEEEKRSGEEAVPEQPQRHSMAEAFANFRRLGQGGHKWK